MFNSILSNADNISHLGIQPVIKIEAKMSNAHFITKPKLKYININKMNTIQNGF